MRARVIERGTGAVVGEIEADTSYGLWMALLMWGEQQGMDRFQVPARYRTERVAASGPADAVTAPAPNRRRARPATAVESPLPPTNATASPTTPVLPPLPAEPAQLPLQGDLGMPVPSDASPAPGSTGARPPRRRRRPAVAAEQLRLFETP